jgi:hypothetical protein
MLGDDSVRAAADDEITRAVEAHFDRLVDALVAETADSDDVYDRESAIRYAELRLSVLQAVLPAGVLARVQAAVFARLQDW